MALGTEVDVSPGDFVLDVDPALPQKGGRAPSPGGGAPSPIFCPFLLRSNGWMHQAATWYGGRPQSRGLCVRRGMSPLPKNGAELPIFGPCLLWPNGWMDEDATWYGSRPRPTPHCIRWGPSFPSPVFGPCLLWLRSPMSATAELFYTDMEMIVI